MAREDFCRGKQGSLSAGFDGGQHRHQRHQRLAGADVALEEPQHRRGLRHIPADLLDYAALRAR
jgi:hypothetical protein